MFIRTIRVVYIKEGAPANFPVGNEPAPLLDQVGCEYQPYVMGVRTGQKFQVKNSDPILHNFMLCMPAKLPPGKYKLAAVHLKAGEQLQDIELTGDAVQAVSFTLDVKTATP